MEQNGDSDKDNGAGNPGIEGEIITLNETEIVIKYDEDLFEDLPSGRWMVSGGEISCAEFQSLLASDKSAYSVVELEEVDGEVTEVRLVSPDESRFSE